MPEELKIERSLALYARAGQLIPGGSQTTSKRPAGHAPGAFPIYAERGKGCRVWDVDGNEYIDYIMALGLITLGYCYAPVDAAIREQLEKGIIYGLLHPLEVEACERIVEMVPCTEMVRFLKGGAEVTSAAARIARAYTGKELILNSGYLGWADTWTAQVEPPNGRGVPECLRSMVKPFPRDGLGALGLDMSLRFYSTGAPVQCSTEKTLSPACTSEEDDECLTPPDTIWGLFC